MAGKNEVSSQPTDCMSGRMSVSWADSGGQTGCAPPTPLAGGALCPSIVVRSVQQLCFSPTQFGLNSKVSVYMTVLNFVNYVTSWIRPNISRYLQTVKGS